MARFGPFVAASLLLLPLLVSTAGVAASSPVNQIVGYDPEDETNAHLVIKAAGGTITRSSAALGIAVAQTSDPDSFRRVTTASPYVKYVENDDATRLSGAQWNGAQWNGAQWNGAQWNGAQWNGAQWNNMRNEGAQWNGAQWNAHQWTIQHSPSKWSFDTGSTDPGLVWQWGAWAIKSPQANEAHGTGTRTATLCVLDSGVAWDHKDVAPNMWTDAAGRHGWNAINPSGSAYDDAGHGTHIASIAAAATGNAFGIAGVGNVQIMAVKVLDANGAGKESDLAFGLEWCATHGADVAVMALSATDDGPTMQRALAFAAGKDVLLLASAGNDGGAVSFPARHPLVTAVTSVDGNLTLSTFSNRGPEVDLAAPGEAMLGAFPGGGFVFGSGTSQAVAMAAGLAARVRDAHPEQSASQARDVLTSSARDLGAAGPDGLYGHGLLDASAALSR